MRDEVILVAAPGETLVLRRRAGVLTAFEAQTTLDQQALPATRRGDILLVRIIRVLRGAKGALADLGQGVTGFLPLPAMVLTPEGRTETPRDGLAALVQVARTGLGDKGPRLTAELSLPGRFCVFLPSRAKTAPPVSAPKILSQAQREALAPPLADGEGVVLRTAAKGATADHVAREWQAHTTAWAEILAAARTAQAPACLRRDATVMERVLRDTSDLHRLRIIAGDAATARHVEGLLARWEVDAPVETVTDPLGTLGLREVLDGLTARTVALPGGGSLVIDATEALTAIDVNGGAEGGVAEGETTRRAINMAAARAIPALIRLRDIGGLVVVDFLGAPDAAQRTALERALKDGTKGDAMAVRLGKLSGFGTLELTRQRGGDGALDRWQAVCGACGGTGRVPAVERVGLDLLAVLASERPVRGQVYLGPALDAWVRARHDRIGQELARFAVAGIQFTRDETAPALAWRLDKEKAS